MLNSNGGAVADDIGLLDEQSWCEVKGIGKISSPTVPFWTLESGNLCNAV